MVVIVIENILLFSILVFFINQSQKYRKKSRHYKIENKVTNNRFNECNRSFNTMFDNTSDGVALLNLQMDFFKLNQNLCDMFGYTMERILKWNMKTLFGDAFSTEHQLEINKLLANKITMYNRKQKFIKKNGDTIWILVTMSLIRNHANQPHYFIMHVQNVTIHETMTAMNA